MISLSTEMGDRPSADGADVSKSCCPKLPAQAFKPLSGTKLVAAFVIVIAYGLLWLTFDQTTFDWNAIATLAVWIMTLFIQRTNRRDSLALRAKLDELLRVDQQARSELVRLDEQEPEAIERHRSAVVRNAAE